LKVLQSKAHILQRVVATAKRYGCRAVGCDIDPLRIEDARKSVCQAGVEDRVSVEQKDLFTVDLRPATVVTLYLTPEYNEKLLPQLARLPPGARVVSHQFNMHGVVPDKVVRVRSKHDGRIHVLYLWTAPVKSSSSRVLGASADNDYPWLGNDLGITDDVPEPWTPVSVDGQRVRVWGRTIDFGEALLPAQITSQNVKLLVASASITVASGGRVLDLSKARARWLENRKDRVVREATAQSGSLTARTVTTVEFDGMIHVKLALMPDAPTSLERVTITVPIDRKVAQVYGRYLNYDFAALRTDKMSLATCTQRITEPIHSDFNPEIWLGNRNVGITWAAETNCQYDLIDAEKTLSVYPKTDSVELVVSIVDHPVTLSEPKTIEFALFPTPLKPVDLRMRQIRLAAFGRHLTAFAADISQENYDYYSICMPHEFEATHNSLPMSSRGERNRRLQERLDKAGVKFIPYGALGYTNAVLEAPRRFYDRWHNTPVSKSTLERWGEYDRGETRDLSLMRGLHWDGYRVCPSPRSYADFLVWAYAGEIKFGDIDGIYFDHGEVSHSCRNPNHDHFRNATGTQHKFHYGVFATRDLLKRLWIATKRINPDLIIIQHQSRSLKSLNSFVDMAVTGEAMNVLFAGSPSSRGVRENPSSYKPDYDQIPELLIDFDYLDTFGFEARILPQVKYCIEPYWKEHPAEYDDYSRKMFRHTLLRGIRQWVGNMSQTAIVEAWTAMDRIGRLDGTVTFHPYWNNADTVSTTHPDTIASYYARTGRVQEAVSEPGGRGSRRAETTVKHGSAGASPSRNPNLKCLLVFVGNCSDEEIDDELTVRLAESFTGAIDAVTGEPIHLEGNRVPLSIPAGLYRAVFLTR